MRSWYSFRDFFILPLRHQGTKKKHINLFVSLWLCGKLGWVLFRFIRVRIRLWDIFHFLIFSTSYSFSFRLFFLSYWRIRHFHACILEERIPRREKNGLSIRTPEGSKQRILRFPCFWSWSSSAFCSGQSFTPWESVYWEWRYKWRHRKNPWPKPGFL